MERREVVNASNEYEQPGEWTFSAPKVEPIASVSGTPFPSSPTANDQPGGLQTPASQAASGPLCLYLGPAGERCYRPALADGFCSRHQLNPTATAPRDEARARRKKAAATVGIVAALWPLIEELIRQIFRLFR
jgi:hypothetical protein